MGEKEGHIFPSVTLLLVRGSKRRICGGMEAFLTVYSLLPRNERFFPSKGYSATNVLHSVRGLEKGNVLKCLKKLLLKCVES